MNRQHPSTTVRLPAITDIQLVRMLSELAALSGTATAFSVSAMGVSLGSFATAEAFEEAYPDDEWTSARRITSASVRVDSAPTIEFARHATTFDSGGGVIGRDASGLEAEVWFIWQQTVPTADAMLQIMEVVERYRAVEPETGRRRSSEPAYVQVFARQIADLTTLQTKIVREADEARARREEELERRRQALETEGEELRAALRAKAEADAEALSRRGAELDLRAKELDDRGHMHARRDLRMQISSNLKERLDQPSVGESVGRQRLYIFAGGILLAGVFVAVGAYSLAEFWETSRAGRIGNNVETYLLSARIAFSAAAVAGIGMYLLGWARQLHDNDVRTDRELERYRYDIDRASWAIETILEAQVKEGGREGGQVPEEWILGATHGLFARSERREEEHSNMEALGQLLSYAAEAEIGPGGTKFKLTPRGVRRLRRSGLIDE